MVQIAVFLRNIFANWNPSYFFDDDWKILCFPTIDFNSLLMAMAVSLYYDFRYFNCEHVLFVNIAKQRKKFRGFYEKSWSIFKIFKKKEILLEANIWKFDQQ